ncbi:putative WRKY transcription factor 35 [Hordeum vulgare]|nr:putative WRKY transcription factor 35 [Hordeum vulgare]
MERHRRPLEEIAERCHGPDEGCVIVLSDNDEEVAVSSEPVRNGDPGQGCSKDASKDEAPSDGNDDDGATTTPPSATSSA